jgi:hypothetical protein
MNNERVDWKLMGVSIGTATGWDKQDTFAMMIYDLEVNEVGQKFVPDFRGPQDLVVDWERGEAATYTDDGSETLLRTDWSVFNKAAWLDCSC